MTDQGKGALYLTCGATMISFGAVFVKVASVGPTISGFYRMLFGGIILLAVLLYRRERILNPHAAIFSAIICGLLFSLDLFLWHRCIYLVGPGLATLLANFQVFFFSAYGILVLKEKLDWKLAVSIPLAMIGLTMIVGIDIANMSSNYRLGVVLGLMTAMSYATFMIVLQRFQRATGAKFSYSAVTIVTITSAVALGTSGLIEGESYRIPDLHSFASLVAYGLAGQVLGWLVIAKGLPRVRASSAGLILLLQPALAFVWDVAFFHRPTMPVEVAGAAIALAAIYLGSTSHSESRPSV
jgi:drug/metabolite transporter (DMT)-like permease